MNDITLRADELRLLDLKDEQRADARRLASEPESHHRYNYEQAPLDSPEITSDELEVLDWNPDSEYRRPDLEPEDWLDGGTPNPNLTPLFQDLPQDDPLRGRAVKCAMRICWRCDRTNPKTDQPFIANVQQTAYLVLLERGHRKTSDTLLDKEVNRRINKDWQRYEQHRTRKTDLYTTTGNGMQPIIKQVVHEVSDVEEKRSAKRWTPETHRHFEMELLLREGKSVQQIAEILNISKSKVYRDKRALQKWQQQTNNPRLPRAENRLPWGYINDALQLPKVPQCPSHIKPEDWPTARSKLHAECHCRGTADCELIDRYLDGKPLGLAERDRLRELAYARKRNLFA